MVHHLNSVVSIPSLQQGFRIYTVTNNKIIDKHVLIAQCIASVNCNTYSKQSNSELVQFQFTCKANYLKYIIY